MRQHMNLEEQTASFTNVFKRIIIKKVAQLKSKEDRVLAKDITTKYYSINSSLQKNQREFLMNIVTFAAGCGFITAIFYCTS